MEIRISVSFFTLGEVVALGELAEVVCSLWYDIIVQLEDDPATDRLFALNSNIEL